MGARIGFAQSWPGPLAEPTIWLKNPGSSELVPRGWLIFIGQMDWGRSHLSDDATSA